MPNILKHDTMSEKANMAVSRVIANPTICITCIVPSLSSINWLVDIVLPNGVIRSPPLQPAL